MNDNKIIMDITETFEQVLDKDFPYSKLDLVFVPNMFQSKAKRKTL